MKKSDKKTNKKVEASPKNKTPLHSKKEKMPKTRQVRIGSVNYTVLPNGGIDMMSLTEEQQMHALFEIHAAEIDGSQIKSNKKS